MGKRAIVIFLLLTFCVGGAAAKEKKPVKAKTKVPVKVQDNVAKPATPATTIADNCGKTQSQKAGAKDNAVKVQDNVAPPPPKICEVPKKPDYSKMSGEDSQRHINQLILKLGVENDVLPAKTQIGMLSYDMIDKVLKFCRLRLAVEKKILPPGIVWDNVTQSQLQDLKKVGVMDKILTDFLDL